MRYLICLLLLVLAVPAAAEAQPMRYATQTITLNAEPVAKGATIGRVLVAAEMSVLQQQPGWLRVELRGWRRLGVKKVVYALPGKRILIAALAKKAESAVRPLTTVVDPDTEITWEGVALTGWVADAKLTDDLNTVWDAAFDLFAKRCTVCHAQRIPHRYTANQWVSLLKVMGPRTGLPKEKQRLILSFLQHHAKDTAPAESTD